MGGNFSKGRRKKLEESDGLTGDGRNKQNSRRAAGRRRHLKQLKRDRRSQRLTKQQLYTLSTELKRTPWYLGRSLGFKEKQVRKVLIKFESSQEQKQHFLLWWRSSRGWDATVQSLVIQLELAGYDYDEYKSIVTSQSGELDIYAKAPELDVKKGNADSFRYDNYDVNKVVDFSTTNDLKASLDFALFLRNSWKKPRSRKRGNSHNEPCTSEDSGIVTSPNLSITVTDSASGETEPEKPSKRKMTSSSKARRRSDSTPDHSVTSSPRHDSDSELQRIFENISLAAESGLKDDRTLSGATASPPMTSQTSLRHHHNAQPSIESQTESYRGELERVGAQQYESSGRSEFGGSKTNYNFFKFGGRGKYPSRFKDKISGLSLTSDEDIVLSDSDNKRIQIFDRFGNFKHAFDTDTELKPKGLTVSPDGKIYVCCGCEIRVYTINGELKMAFGQGTFRNNSYSVCCDTNGNCYVTDIVGHTVSVYDDKGDIRKRFGYLGHRMMNFNQPVALVISQRGELLISDTQNHAVKVYSLAGRPLYAIGGKGTVDGRFWNPFGICFDAGGLLYVADCGNDRISVFDQKYKFLRHVLTSDDGLRMPSFIQINSANQLVVAEWNSQEIKIFSLETAV